MAGRQQWRISHALVTCAVMLFTFAAAKGSEKKTAENLCPNIRLKSVGCYSDPQTDPRPLPLMEFTDRNKTSIKYSGISPDYDYWDTYMEGLICRCAKAAKRSKFKMFGIQNNGECMTGMNDVTLSRYAKYGPSIHCVTFFNERCNNGCICIGEDQANFIYTIEYEEFTEVQEIEHVVEETERRVEVTKNVPRKQTTREKTRKTKSADNLCPNIRLKSVGCYSDPQTDPRPLPLIEFTDRNKTSIKYTGISPDYDYWDNYMEGLICRCAKAAKRSKFKMFGIQNNGECMTGVNDVTLSRYAKYGPSIHCVTYLNERCNNGSICIGEDHANFIYMIEYEEVTEVQEIEHEEIYVTPKPKTTVKRRPTERPTKSLLPEEEEKERQTPTPTKAKPTTIKRRPTERPTKKPTKPLLPEVEPEEEERATPRPTKAKPTTMKRRPTERPTKKPTKPLLPEVEPEEEEKATPRPTKAKPTTIKRRPTERPTKKPTKPLLPEVEPEEERATPRPTKAKPTTRKRMPTERPTKKPTKPLLPEEEEEEEEEERPTPRPTKAKPTAIIRRPTERPTKKPTKPLLPEVEPEEEERATPRPTKAKPTTIKRRPTERPTKKPTKPLLPEVESAEEERATPGPTKAKPTTIKRRPTERPTKKTTKPLLPEEEEEEEEEERPTPKPTKAKPTTIKRRPTEIPTKKPTKPLLPEGEGEERATPRPTRKPTKKIIPQTNNTMKTKPTTGTSRASSGTATRAPPTEPPETSGTATQPRPSQAVKSGNNPKCKDYVVSIKVPRFKNELVTADGVTTWIKNVFKGYHCFQSATFVKSRRLPFTNKRALTLELKFACTGRHLGRLVKAVGGVNIIAKCHQTGLCLKTMENISTCQIPICTVPCYFIPMTYTAVHQPVLQHPLLKWQRRYRGSSLYTGLQHYWGSQPLTAYGNMRHTGPQGYIPYGHNTGFQHTGAQGYYPYGQNTGLRHPGPQGHLPYSPIAGLRHTGPQGHAKYGHNTGLRYAGIQGYIPYSHTGLPHTGHQAVTSLGHQKKYLTYLTYHPVTYRVTYDSLNIPLKFNDMSNNPAYGISQPYTRHFPQAVSSKRYSPGKAIKPKQAVKKHYIYRNKHRSIY